MNKHITILLVIILALAAGFFVFGQAGTRFAEDAPAAETRGEEKQVSSDNAFLQERKLIGDWIVLNDLNQYGDPKDMVYIGGTPLFDESTGESIDKYEYILQNYPDKPWLR